MLLSNALPVVAIPDRPSWGVAPLILHLAGGDAHEIQATGIPNIEGGRLPDREYLGVLSTQHESMRRETTRPSLLIAVLAFETMVAIQATAQSVDPAQQAPSPPTQTVRSPDESIELEVSIGGPLAYSVRVNEQPLIVAAQLGLKLRDGTTFGRNVELVSATHQSQDSTWENPFGKRRIVRDQHNQLNLLLRERSAEGRTFSVVFRASNDGVAFRYELLSQPGMREFVLEQELTEFAFVDDYSCYAGEQEKGFVGPQEWEFARRRLSDIKPDSIIGLPVLVETPTAWVAVAEADLLDWAGLWLGGVELPPKAEDSVAKTLFSPIQHAPVTLIAKLAPRPDEKGLVTAKTPHRSPWRVLMIGRHPGRLIESELIRTLSTPSALKNSSWVKPGMIAWDHWWTGDTVMDTATIKKYIQLAADMGWPYQLIDWGWYGESNKPESDITKAVQSLDLEEVRRFAQEKGVRLWLWLHWNDVQRNDAYQKAFPLYQEWGIAGVKIDFMERDDQQMVLWYEKVTRAAADRQLMVNFHGAFKPSGFDRTFPNQITREGVLGNEYNKWSARVTPEHKLTLPFTRCLLGPADFTPGGFLNRQPAQFQSQKPTLVQGTRAAELALFVVYDSPLACACDHPDHYRNQPGADFLKIVPTVWDETRVLEGTVGEFLAMARQSGDDWFLGAVTNSKPRELGITLDFLPPGRWKMRLWKDAADADENASHLATEERSVRTGDAIMIRLAPAGGCVARFQRQ
jgi:alpha-glucosidase